MFVKLGNIKNQIEWEFQPNSSSTIVTRIKQKNWKIFIIFCLEILTDWDPKKPVVFCSSCEQPIYFLWEINRVHKTHLDEQQLLKLKKWYKQNLQ